MATLAITTWTARIIRTMATIATTPSMATMAFIVEEGLSIASGTIISTIHRAMLASPIITTPMASQAIPVSNGPLNVFIGAVWAAWAYQWHQGLPEHPSWPKLGWSWEVFLVELRSRVS